MAMHEQPPVLDLRDGRPADECGITGVRAPLGGALYLARLAQKENQHRGQEGFGFSAYEIDGTNPYIQTIKRVGKIGIGMSEEEAMALMPKAQLAIGQNRYPTNGTKNAMHLLQPRDPEQSDAQIAVAHNGNFNMDLLSELAREYGVEGVDSRGRVLNDSAIFSEILGKITEETGHIEPALFELLPKLQNPEHYGSAYNLTILTQDSVIGVRDPEGVRPLWRGAIPQLGALVLSSEKRSLEATGATAEAEVKAGTYVVFNEHGVTERRWAKENLRSCLFELIYLSKAGNIINGTKVEDYRFAAGRKLAEKAHEAGVMHEVDMIIPVLGSGKHFAHGVATATQKPYEENGLINTNGDRSFIEANDAARVVVIQDKFTVDPEVVEGKDIAIVDDSIVRGNTTRQIIRMLKDAGAKSIVVLVGAPRYIDTCHHGVDVQDKSELIAYGRDDEAIAKEIDAKKVIFLELDEAYDAAGWTPENTCAGCMGGSYAGCNHAGSKTLIAA